MPKLGKMQLQRQVLLGHGWNLKFWDEPIFFNISRIDTLTFILLDASETLLQKI
jgi:hypothetical protein